MATEGAYWRLKLKRFAQYVADYSNDPEVVARANIELSVLSAEEAK